jgi:hypothetical protein
MSKDDRPTPPPSEAPEEPTGPPSGGEAPPPYKPDFSLITYIEKSRKPPPRTVERSKRR